MSPMEAWHIVSKNLADLYAVRKMVGGQSVPTGAETEAEVMCFVALKKLAENQKVRKEIK